MIIGVGSSPDESLLQIPNNCFGRLEAEVVRILLSLGLDDAHLRKLLPKSRTWLLNAATPLFCTLIIPVPRTETLSDVC